jgi:sulfite reductase (NADPH) flavoprotein alpha-component
MLALVISLFVLIASVTGIILAIEPISNELQPYAVRGSSNQSIAELMATMNNEFEEVVSIQVDEHGFMKASVFTREGKNESFYIHPDTGKNLGGIVKRASIYDFATNLHRSLFLKSTGRFIIGLVSFLMVIIIVTGIHLVAKRQGGFKRWFSKVVREDFNQYLHVVLGRFAFIPLLIIAISGVLLSMERFEILPESELSVSFYDIDHERPNSGVTDFEIFKSHPISELVSLEYPFSTDEEDFFVLKLKDSEYQINQYTGQVLMTGQTPVLRQILSWSYVLHTGQGSIIWALILLLSCFAILFFMFSGFSMSFKRLSNRSTISNTLSKDEAQYVVLVGSETGNTNRFAEAFSKSLIEKGMKVFIDKMNNYTVYKKATQLILLTSTYGEGDAPASANQFNEKFKNITQPKNMDYSVVGFGSLMYPEYCKYAVVVDELLGSNERYQQLMPVFKINNQSETAFKEWANQWSEKSGVSVHIQNKNLSRKVKGLRPIEVAKKSSLNCDDTFTIQLKPKHRLKFTSGDLLAIYPEEDKVERLYSIGKIDDQIFLSLKRHEQGLVSNFMNQLKPNEMIEAKIKRNYEFHFPTHASEVVLIANGTGIAPFLGMINENHKNVKTHLFWGGRTKESLNLYTQYVDKAFESGLLTSFHVAYSREEKEKKYVQELIEENRRLFKRVLANDGVIMICGAIAMQNEVINILDQLTKEELNQPLSHFEANEQLKMDCY